jgi:hypothetical protein
MVSQSQCFVYILCAIPVPMLSIEVPFFVPSDILRLGVTTPLRR